MTESGFQPLWWSKHLIAQVLLLGQFQLIQIFEKMTSHKLKLPITLAISVMFLLTFGGCRKADNSLPVLTTKPLNIISINQVQTGGVITNSGGSDITSKGIAWSMASSPSTGGNHTVDGSGSQEYTSMIQVLEPGKQYFVRAYAINNAGTAYGEELIFTTAVHTPGQGVSDVEGNHYNSVHIGKQEWMAENLKTTTYRNGQAIQNITSLSDWNNNTTGAYVWYDNDPAWKNMYGALYNWYAVNNSNELCPSGWRIPSVTDWNYLEAYLGGIDNAGKILKGTATEPDMHPRWDLPNSGATNDLGFNALPGGYRNDGVFYSIGRYGFWWTDSSSGIDKSSARALFFDEAKGPLNYLGFKSEGLCVRCIKN